MFPIVFPKGSVELPKGGAMWIEIDGAHKAYCDVAKLDSIVITYVGVANYKVVGRIGDRDILLKCKLASQKEAEEWLDGLVRQLMS